MAWAHVSQVILQLRCHVVVGGVILLIIIWACAPRVTSAVISFPHQGGVSDIHAELPYSHTEVRGVRVKEFSAELQVTSGLFGGWSVRVMPDDCISTAQVNGSLVDMSKYSKRERCWPQSITFRPNHGLLAGDNTIWLSIQNLHGYYGLHALAIAPVGLALAAAWLIWLCLALVWSYIAGACTTSVYRVCLRLAMPLLAFIATAAVHVNSNGSVDWKGSAIIGLGATSVAITLLFRVFDRESNHAIGIRPSLFWFVTAMLAALWVANGSLGSMSSSLQFSLWIATALCGALAVHSAADIWCRAKRVPQASLVALIASAAPLIFTKARLVYWEYFSAPTTWGVIQLLGLIGIDAKAPSAGASLSRKYNYDYKVIVYSDDFMVRIGSWCSGLEGVTLFVFLVSCFVLADWQRFTRPHCVVHIFIATMLVVIALNIVRIAAIFAYAEWQIANGGTAAVVHETIDVFHSNAGLVLYAASFGPFLSMIYHWTARQTNVSPHGTEDSV